MSGARHLILLYDFLSQGEGGELPISCSDCAGYMNSELACGLMVQTLI